MIVSKGPQHDADPRSPDNMIGAEFLPQTSILPQVDLVITHGGNNTVTECAVLRQADGRAAAVLGPVRQRAAHATRPASASGWTPTGTSPSELLGAVDRLLADGALRERLAAIVARGCRRRRAPSRAADLIEQLA